MEFDAELLRVVRPAYYGRYVDDILLVVPLPVDPAANDEDPVRGFIQQLLVKPRLLRDTQDGAFNIRNRAGLRLQQSKCILQYFDARQIGRAHV